MVQAGQTEQSSPSPGAGRPGARGQPGESAETGPVETALGAAAGAAGPVLVAVVACALCFLGGWRGTDWATQVYRADQAARWGLALWDPGWFGGTYPLNYSLVLPIGAGVLGLRTVALLSAAGAAFCFDRLVTRGFGRRPLGSWYFAVATVIEVAIGQLPTLAGEALALGSVLCLAGYTRARRSSGPTTQTIAVAPPAWPSYARLAAGVVLGALAALVSPVVGAFLALVLVAWGFSCAGRSTPGPAIALLSAGALTLVSTAALPIAFPGAGYFPFNFGDLLVILAICALLASPLLQAARPVRASAVLYGAVSVGLFVFPTQMGGNDARLAAYIGVPLVICYLWPREATLAPLALRGVPVKGRRPALAAVALLALTGCLVVWHWVPIIEAFSPAGNGPSSTAAYYKPLVDELRLLNRGHVVRVEVPPTVDHWESAYVASAFPLARGWERQLDVAYNSLFYQPGRLQPSAYRAWLLDNGVSYVALPAAPLDYAATAEASLLRLGSLRSARSGGLQLVWESPNWQLWRVRGSTGLVTGPAKLVSLSPRSVVVRFETGGRSILKLRWSSYWSLSRQTEEQACVQPAPGGWTEVGSDGAGDVRLSLSLFGPDRGHCPAS